ncbi:hypothetical protein KBB96_18265 [Luteolibacter ambystomatis]|uniref:Uncharacterized protein n=1 Tax=Luteolibacter ambystomatis TaxID=2824561 RepID=A0A975IZ08_9BACT|nr:hypothetical protein [Luteolibacter ambystomatis]QUE50792.1 hypothetical protein KBB96_18265 [Luteolibacter ambystomatis]
MIRILLVSGASLVALFASSCCCTSEAKAPKLRKLPQFQELPAAAPQHEIIPTK